MHEPAARPSAPGRRSHRPALALGTAVLACLAAGCGSNSDDASPVQDSPSAPVSTPATTAPPSDSVPSTPSITPSATPSATASATPSKPAPKPTARDGSNLRSCGDANCQVLVRGRTTIRFDGGKLVITKIVKFAHFELSGMYGGGSGQLGPGTGGGDDCAVTFGYGGLSSRCGGTKPIPRSDDPPGLTLRVTYINKGTAVVDLHRV